MESFIDQLEVAQQGIIDATRKAFGQLTDARRHIAAQEAELEQILSEFDRAADAFADKKKSNVLKLNVGGTPMDMPANVLEGCKHCTFFSCLLKQRWNCLMMKDKDGRVFLDYDSDWLMPILDSLVMSSLDVAPAAGGRVICPPLSAPNREGLLALAKHFHTPLLAANPFSTSAVPCVRAGIILEQMPYLMDAALIRSWKPQDEEAQYQQLYQQHYGHYGLQHHQYYQQQFHSSYAQSYPFRDADGSTKQTVFSRSGDEDLLVVVEDTASKQLIGFVTDMQIVRGQPATSADTAVFVVSTAGTGITDAQWYTGAKILCDGCFNSCSWDSNGKLLYIGKSAAAGVVVLQCNVVETYGIKRLIPDDHGLPKILEVAVAMEAATSTLLSSWKEHVHLNSAHSKLKVFDINPQLHECAAHLNSFDSFTQLLAAMQGEVKAKNRSALAEVLFVEQHVCKAFGFPLPPTAVVNSLSSFLEQVGSCVKRLQSLLPQVQAKNQGAADPRNPAGSIVYLNAGGKKFCINRQCLLKAFPDSQLDVRLSGRWTEQPSDVDEDGYILYRLPAQAFLAIVNAVRLCEITGSDMKIIVPSAQKAHLDCALEYLAIGNVHVETR